MTCHNCEDMRWLTYDPWSTYPNSQGELPCPICNRHGSTYPKKEQPMTPMPTPDRANLIERLDELMRAMSPVEFACYEVMNHAGDLAVALLDVDVVNHLNEARLIILSRVADRLDDDLTPDIH